MKKILILGAGGFIGRNLTGTFSQDKNYDVWTSFHENTDLTDKRDVRSVLKDMDIVIQVAATTSGAEDIINRPYYHVTDNAVMNSLLLREVFEQSIPHFIFFSCTVMYPQNLNKPVEESDFNGKIYDKYFGVGWTKVYIEKMCEFYSRLGRTKFMVIRHSNIYGPYDKFDPKKSHVLGATVAKVMQSKGKVTVWGEGKEERDLLYVSDLVDFVKLAIKKQKTPYELVNVGLGKSISVKELVEKIIKISGRRLEIEFDKTKPTIPTKLVLDCAKAEKVFGWKPKVSLEQGIKKTLNWYRKEIYEND